MFDLTGWVRGWLSCYFSSVEAEGVENLPAGKPIMLVSNHTNALVDPFVIWASLGRPLRLTGKATLTKDPLLWIVFKALKVIAFHRADERDGPGRTEANLAALRACREAMHRGEWLCIFPEGKSHTRPGMMPFKTGAARIALGYRESHPGSDLAIVPVGLFYESKFTFGSRVLCKIGAPIPLAAWVAEHGAHPRALTRALEAAVQAVTTNYRRRLDSVLVHWASEIWRKRRVPPAPLGHKNPIPPDAVRVAQAIAERYYRSAGIPGLKDLESRVLQFRRTMRGYGLSVEELFLPLDWGKALFFLFREGELILLGAPLFLLSLAAHALPLALLRAVVRRTTKDLDQWASNTLFGGLGVFGLFYGALFLGLLLLHPLWAVPVPIILAYVGTFSLQVAQRFRETLRRARTFALLVARPGVRGRLRRECEAIFAEMAAIKNMTDRPSPS